MYTQMHIEGMLPGPMTPSGEDVRRHNFNGIDIGSQVKKQTADYLLSNERALYALLSVPGLHTNLVTLFGFPSLAEHKPLIVPVARPTGRFHIVSSFHLICLIFLERRIERREKRKGNI